jgi:hypothetical protein
MSEESIEQAKEIILTSLNASKIMELDKYELIFNINYFLVHYEKETGCKVMKKVKKC